MIIVAGPATDPNFWQRHFNWLAVLVDGAAVVDVVFADDVAGEVRRLRRDPQTDLFATAPGGNELVEETIRGRVEFVGERREPPAV